MTDLTARDVAALDVLKTYRYLRLAMVLLVGMLTAAVLWQTLGTSPHCLQPSISAYYYTPARAVFVAALGAIGASLIVYHGNTATEDVLLNFTGIAAIVVAFVPTPLEASCSMTNVPSQSEVADAVTNNGWSLLLTGLVAVAIATVMGRDTFRSRFSGAASRFWLIVTSVVVVAGGVLFVVDRSGFRHHGHAVAAVSLFAGIVLVVVTNSISFGRSRQQSHYRNRYGAVATAMLVSLVSAVVAHLVAPGFSTWRFWLEAAVILEFGVYWVVQTTELWNVATRADSAVNRR